jgi:spore germination protein KC
MTRNLVIRVRKTRVFVLMAAMIFSCMILTGCWNYREVEQLAIASGAALDKNPDGSVHLTIEVVNIAGDGEVTYEPKYVESDGNTFFEAARIAVTKEGKRIYWSHAKVVIFSEEIAREDIVKYLDFLFRDAEAREDTWLLISREKTAGEILQSKGMLKPMVSFEIDDTMRSQKAISRFPFVEMYEFFDRLFYKQVSPILPAVHLVEQHDEKTPQVGGTAVFKDKKLIGFLNDDDTKLMLWLRNEVKGGLIIIKNAAGTKENVTLEIYKSKTKITPVIQDGVLKMKAEIDLDVSIGEIMGSTDFISSTGKQKLAKASENQLEEEIKKMYTLVRDKYNADVFGFGRRVEMKMPDVWSQIKNDWDGFFAELELDLNVNVNIRGSATTRTPLRVGE